MTRSTRTFLAPSLLLLLLLPGSLAFAGDSMALTEALAEGDEDADDEDADDEGDDELPPWAEPKDGEGDDDDSKTEGEGGEAEGGASGEAESADAAGEAAEAAPAVATDDGSWKGGGLVGLGFLVGTDNGLSLKLWPSRTHGVHIHLSAPLRLNALSVGFAYQIHLAGLPVPGSRVQLHPYVGPSFRLRVFVYNDNAAYVDGHGGASIGMSVTVANVPAEIFFEVVPGLTFGINIPGVGIGFDVGGHVGARFYFGS